MDAMTEPSTGAGGTAVEITVKRFNQGDRVFIPAVIHAEYEGRTQPIYAVLALGDVPADRVLPSSDALPAVAAWLAEMPEGTVEHMQRAFEQYFRNNVFTRDMRTTRRLQSMRSLIAALTTDGGA